MPSTYVCNSMDSMVVPIVWDNPNVVKPDRRGGWHWLRQTKNGGAEGGGWCE